MLDFLEVFDKSLARVCAKNRGDVFYQRFYDLFMARDPEVAKKFANTDMERQKEMLRESLTEMRIFFEEHVATPYITVLARLHGPSGRDIHPRLFEAWLDSLVAAVEELDPEYSIDVLTAWRIVMSPGIEFMRLAASGLRSTER